MELHPVVLQLILRQLQGAYGKRGHGNHGDWVQDCLAHQLWVVDNLSSNAGLRHDRWLAEAGSSIHLLVRNGVRNVAHHRLADGHRLWVQRELLPQVGYVVEGGRVHSDVADGLSRGRQLDWAGGGRGCEVGNVLGLGARENMVNSLNDGGVSSGRMGDNSRLHGGGRHEVSLCRDNCLGLDQGLGLEGGRGVGRDMLLGQRQNRRAMGSSDGGHRFQELRMLAMHKLRQRIHRAVVFHVLIHIVFSFCGEINEGRCKILAEGKRWESTGR